MPASPANRAVAETIAAELRRHSPWQIVERLTAVTESVVRVRTAPWRQLASEAIDALQDTAGYLEDLAADESDRLERLADGYSARYRELDDPANHARPAPSAWRAVAGSALDLLADVVAYLEGDTSHDPEDLIATYDTVKDQATVTAERGDPPPAGATLTAEDVDDLRLLLAAVAAERHLFGVDLDERRRRLTERVGE